MMNVTQLELELNTRHHRPRHPRQRARVARAQWWFARMHQAVENAVDWRANTPAPAEQIWLTGARRSIKI